MSSITTFLFFVSLCIASLSLPPTNREDIVLKEEKFLYATKVMKTTTLELEEITTYVDEGSTTIRATPAPPKLPAEGTTTCVDETTPVPEEPTTCVDDENPSQTPPKPTPIPIIPTSRPPPSPPTIPTPAPPAPDSTYPASQPPKSESSGGGPSVGAIIGAAAAIILLIVCSSIISLVVWIVLRKKKKSTKEVEPTETPAAEDANVEVYSKQTIFGTTVNPELRPYHIPPDKFTYKGPVVLHNAILARPKEHRFAQQKSKSIKAVEWNDAANEAYEIGSKIEQIEDVAPEEEMSTIVSDSENVQTLDEIVPLDVLPPAPPVSRSTVNSTTRSNSAIEKGKTSSKKTKKSPKKRPVNQRLKKPRKKQ